MSSEFKVKSKQNIPTILAHKKLKLYDNDVDDSKILLYHYYSVCYLANILHICQVHETSTQFCAIATVIGRYMHLQCYLQLHGGDNIGEDIMIKAKEEQFDAYLCLRQTI